VQRTTNRNERVAVIGAGVAGLTAGYLLSRRFDVTVYEADERLGGHAHTHDVVDAAGRANRIDSGFIVHNERTYPRLRRLFGELGVKTQPTEMSMSIRCDGCGLEYAGGRGPGGVVAQPRRLAQARFLRMLAEVRRFHRAAKRVLAEGNDELTWGGFLAEHRFSRYFVQHFAVPLVACVWSSGYDAALGYPARYLFRFLDHHGMLNVTGSPRWRTVTGGSATYVDALKPHLGHIRTQKPVTAVLRHDDGVQVRTADDMTTEYDRVVLATHADTALDVLDDATAEEKSLLTAFDYTENPVWLHQDASVLPKAPRARSSWNYRLTGCDDPSGEVLVSYWMNRLHGLDSPDDYLVTLNPGGWVDESTVISAMTYHHPVFTRESVAAGRELRTAGGPRLAFAGAHLGWGFHEDGCRSGVEAAARFGAGW
jgi:uncharacterized protein